MGYWKDSSGLLMKNSRTLVGNRFFRGAIAATFAIGFLAPALLSFAATMFIVLPVLLAVGDAFVRPMTKNMSFSNSMTSADSNRKNDEKAGKESSNPVFNALVDRLRDSHIRVVTDWKEARHILDNLPDKYKVFKDKNAVIYGFVHNGVIYLNPDDGRVDIPVHEYTHLWAEVLRERNRSEWDHIVSLLKKETSLWEEIKRNYPHLENDDEIADEVLATFSGRRGAQKLNDPQYRHLDPKGLFESLLEALELFWKSVGDFFDIHYDTKEDIADRVLSDMLRGINPLASSLGGKVEDGLRPAMEHKEDYDNNKNNITMEEKYSKDQVKSMLASLSLESQQALRMLLSEDTTNKERDQLIGRILMDPVNGRYWAGNIRDNVTVLNLLWDGMTDSYKQDNAAVRENIDAAARSWAQKNYSDNRRYIQKMHDLSLPYAKDLDMPFAVFLQEPVNLGHNKSVVGIFVDPVKGVDEDALFISYNSKLGNGVQLTQYGFDFERNGHIERFDHLTTLQMQDVFHEVQRMTTKNTLLPIMYNEHYGGEENDVFSHIMVSFGKKLDDATVDQLADFPIIHSVLGSEGSVFSNTLRKEEDYEEFNSALYLSTHQLLNRNTVLKEGKNQYEIYFQPGSNMNLASSQYIGNSPFAMMAMNELLDYHHGRVEGSVYGDQLIHLHFAEEKNAKEFLYHYLNRNFIAEDIVDNLLRDNRRLLKDSEKIMLKTYITERGGFVPDGREQAATLLIRQAMIKNNIHSLGDDNSHERYIFDVLKNIAANERYPEVQYHGDVAKAMLSEILNNAAEYNDAVNYPLYYGAQGMFKDGDKTVAFDNSTGDCWVEEFYREANATLWLCHDRSVDELHRKEKIIECRHIVKDLIRPEKVGEEGAVTYLMLDKPVSFSLDQREFVARMYDRMDIVVYGVAFDPHTIMPGNYLIYKSADGSLNSGIMPMQGENLKLYDTISDRFRYMRNNDTLVPVYSVFTNHGISGKEDISVVVDGKQYNQEVDKRFDEFHLELREPLSEEVISKAKAAGAERISAGEGLIYFNTDTSDSADVLNVISVYSSERRKMQEERNKHVGNDVNLADFDYMPKLERETGMGVLQLTKDDKPTGQYAAYDVQDNLISIKFISRSDYEDYQNAAYGSDKEDNLRKKYFSGKPEFIYEKTDDVLKSYQKVHGWTHDDPALIYNNTKTDVYFLDDKRHTIENIDNDAGIDAFEHRTGAFYVETESYDLAYEQLEKHDRQMLQEEAVSAVSAEGIKDIIRPYNGYKGELFFRVEVPVHENSSGQYALDVNKEKHVEPPVSLGIVYNPDNEDIRVLYAHHHRMGEYGYNTVLGLSGNELTSKEAESIINSLSGTIKDYGRLVPVVFSEEDIELADDTGIGFRATTEVFSDKFEEFAEDHNCEAVDSEERSVVFNDYDDLICYAAKASDEVYSVIKADMDKSKDIEKALSDAMGDEVLYFDRIRISFNYKDNLGRVRSCLPLVVAAHAKDGKISFYSSASDLNEGVHPFAFSDIVSEERENVIRMLSKQLDITDDRLLSDDRIAQQYSDFRISGIKFYEQTQPDCWSGVVDLEFPNADHPDFDSSMCNPFISYDAKGEKIAFDNWLPEEVYKSLCDTIRSEHLKHQAVRAVADRVNDMSSHAHFSDEQRVVLRDYLKTFGDDRDVQLKAIEGLRQAAMGEEDMQNKPLHWIDDVHEEMNDMLDGKIRTAEGYGRGI